MGASHTRVKIVSEALFPSDVHSEFDEGIWLAPRQFDAIVPSIGLSGSITDARVVAVQFAPGIFSNTGIEHLQSELATCH